MSRIGKKPITVPPKVTIAVADHAVNVEGPLGKLQWAFPADIAVAYDEPTRILHVTRERDDRQGRALHGLSRAMIQNMDSLPWVADVYQRDLKIENYFIGYLQHPYVSMYTGRGCPAQCTFCLWPQTIGGHQYRVRSAGNVAAEMSYMKKLFPQVYRADPVLVANSSK